MHCLELSASSPVVPGEGHTHGRVQPLSSWGVGDVSHLSQGMTSGPKYTSCITLCKLFDLSLLTSKMASFS